MGGIDDGNPWARVAAAGGIVAHVATAVLYAASGLVVPTAGLAVLWVAWLAMLLAAIRLRRSRPWLTLAVPVVSVAFWVLVLTVGEAVFGWTA